ncbi:hypothetical protein W97_07846 [Coniosporium apollinis CBS 100218]|uniref:Aminoglycoside phosphotransferase domain-containing protein n=1 Tax=Coniosporium apollinis (strain CBS 100218) TaxID=1168221 RepID=R7Z3D7_CONA1|nr:uncharacterized protein W97_07846 [Coniosporium apollinis CBS 100218]EON68588.1 hypothetical protein W97_07846 [Coniosporium apollinis CBS 100218]
MSTSEDAHNRLDDASNHSSHSRPSLATIDEAHKGLRRQEAPHSLRAADEAAVDIVSVHTEESDTKQEDGSFSTYQLQLEKLCHSLWPALPKEAIEFEPIEGSDWSHVIGVTIKIPTPRDRGRRALQKVRRALKSKDRIVDTEEQHYVLRVPRSKSVWIEHEVATVNYVRQYTNVPAPGIVEFDCTKDDALGKQFVLQRRTAGKTLLSVFPTLNHQQKASVAKAFGQVLLAMQVDSHLSAGLLSLNLKLAEEDSDTELVQFPVSDRIPSSHHLSPPTEPSHPQSTLDFLLMQLKRWSALRDHTELEWDRMQAMAWQMALQDLFDDDRYYLCLLALEPRNILVTIRDEATVTFEAILGWGNAIFAPKFMACAPPTWLWNCDDNGKNADDSSEPDDVAQEVKHAFEKVVGKDYLRYAYKPEYRLARKLCDFAIHGMESRQEEVHEMLTGWEVLRRVKLREDMKRTRHKLQGRS